MTIHHSNMLTILALSAGSITGGASAQWDEWNGATNDYGCFVVLETGAIAAGDISASLEDFFYDDYWFSHRNGAWWNSLVEDFHVLGNLRFNDYDGHAISELASRGDVGVLGQTFDLNAELSNSARHIQADDYLGKALPRGSSWVKFEVLEPTIINYTFEFEGAAYYMNQTWGRRLNRIEYLQQGSDFEGWYSVETLIDDGYDIDVQGPNSIVETPMGNPANRSGSIELQPGVYSFVTHIGSFTQADVSPVGHSLGYAASRCSLTFECVERQRAGDFNNDGQVDGADMTELLGAWGTSNPGMDLDNNGLVDGADLTLLMGDWG